MNAAILLDHYARIADAPDAIARLRRFVLDLAVRGKLVEQDVGDEPASALLERIAAEKTRLIKEGQVKRDRALPPIQTGDISLELPNGWALCRLGDLAQLVTSGSRDWAKHYSNEGAIFIRMGNLCRDHYRLRLDHIQHVKAPTDGEGTRTRLAAGDILISITGEVGMLGLIPENFGEAYINQHTAMVRPIGLLGSRYLPELFRSPFAQDQFNEPQRGIKNSFRLTDITQFVVPLPPLAEQHRIVAKVDELMALCDQLEAARAERETARNTFTLSTLAKLNTPDPETFGEDARFALANLAPLTTRADQIKQLRQTILNLAVRGKLVEQDAADEPASELLKRTNDDIERYCSANRVARAKPEPLTDDAVPFALPTGWSWGRLCQLFRVITDGDHQPPPRADEGVAFLTIGNVTTGKLNFDGCRLVPDSYFHALPAYRTPTKGDILYTVVGATYGRPALVDSDREFCVQRHIAIFKPTQTLELGFLLLLLASPHVYDQASSSTTGTAQPTIALRPLRNFVVPVPPIAEQRRIVTKVDELMALCDQLEASLTTGEQTRSRLLEAVLHHALEPA